MKKFVRYVCAPVIGALLCIPWISQDQVQKESSPSSFQIMEIQQKLDLSHAQMQQISNHVSSTQNHVVKLKDALQAANALLLENRQKILELKKKQTVKPITPSISETLSKLGTVIGASSSKNSEMKVYKYITKHYRAYVLWIHPKTSSAISMALGKDKVGGSETTLSAVTRTGAIAGVNAGGFADGNGKRYPLLNTFIHNAFVSGFYADAAIEKNITFIGFNQQLKLVGGIYKTEEEARSHDLKFGVSFVPILIKNGQKVDIPYPWNKSPYRAPRTVVASLSNGDTLFIVTDGYNEQGSSGATLEELQNKLLNLHVVDAFNLDGGGSSSLIFKGKVVNHPSDGNLRKLPTHFLMY